jgi:uncharacterized protein
MESISVSTQRDFLRLNVGFIIHQTVGYYRDFPFESDKIHIPPDLDLEQLSGNAKVTRAAQGLLVQVKMRANTAAQCVRCLDDFSQPLEIEFTELYAFSPNSATESGLLVPEIGKIDLEPLIREEMLLAVPISPLCSPDCKGICPVCGGNRNETPCQHDEGPLESRLDVLQNLLEQEQNST